MTPPNPPPHHGWSGQSYTRTVLSLLRTAALLGVLVVFFVVGWLM